MPNETPDPLCAAYGELRALARWLLRRQRGDHDDPGATSLVHEAYLRLGDGDVAYRDRGHFLATAARAMRFVLVDAARRRGALKRGGDRVSLQVEDPALVVSSESALDLLSIDEALRALSAHMPRKAAVVELRFFGGLSNEEAANTLGVSLATVKRDWQIARAWLHRYLHARASSVA